LKAGGAYVPLDPHYPTERLTYMLSDAAPKVLLTQKHLRDQTADVQIDTVTLDGDWSDVAKHEATNPERIVHAHHLAYVIYTSGSTGRPKGVMVEHAGVVNYLHWALRTYSPDYGTAVPVSSPLAFDATVTSLYFPLLTGRSVVLLPDGRELDGLEQLIQQPAQWSLVKISPAHLQALGHRMQQRGLQQTVGTFVIGGEALSPAVVTLWRTIWPAVHLVNEYGPTETVVGCCVYDVPEGWAAESNVPIGGAIANTRMYILNQHLQPVPVGVTGEIFIGGAGVTRGYLNRPDLTAERFVPDPFASGPEDRMYRSGDLARWRSDGSIEYLGRNDQQTKLRGFRIELGEIEAQLAHHPDIKEVSVIAREDVPGEKRLVAYLTSQHGTPPTPAQLRAHLAVVLPDYMIPSAFVVLEELPLTPNGKLDRRALAPPEMQASGGDRYEQPIGEVEGALGEIWREILQIRRVGRRDNFFELGGHSLLGVRLISQIEERLGVRASVIWTFQYPTIEQMAQAVEAVELEEGVI